MYSYCISISEGLFILRGVEFCHFQSVFAVDTVLHYRAASDLPCSFVLLHIIGTINKFAYILPWQLL